MWSANGKRTGKHPCARQDLAAARRARDLALDLAAYLQQQLLNLEDSSSEKAMQVKQELNEAKKELREANREVDKAKQEVEKAEQKYAAKASVQAGRVQAGASAFAVVAVAFGLQHSRVCFRAVHRFCFLGSCSPLSKDPLVVKLSPLRSLRGVAGAFRSYRVEKAPLWLRQRFHANLVAPRVLPHA